MSQPPESFDDADLTAMALTYRLACEDLGMGSSDVRREKVAAQIMAAAKEGFSGGHGAKASRHSHSEYRILILSKKVHRLPAKEADKLELATLEETSPVYLFN